MSDSLFEKMEPASGEASGWYTAHCDGGSRGNPGPSAYGAVIEDPTAKVVARLSAFLGTQTNNYAEYKGLLAVLAWAKEHRVRQLRVVSDSELMVKQMKGQYKVASPGLRPLWEEAKLLVRQLERFEMRHTLRGGNKEADQLANDAMDKATGRPAAGRPSPTAGRPGPSSATPAGIQKLPSAAVNTQVFEGYVKGGVVHLLEGDLPDGTFVKVTKK